MNKDFDHFIQRLSVLENDLGMLVTRNLTTLAGAVIPNFKYLIEEVRKVKEEASSVLEGEEKKLFDSHATQLIKDLVESRAAIISLSFMIDNYPHRGRFHYLPPIPYPNRDRDQRQP